MFILICDKVIIKYQNKSGVEGMGCVIIEREINQRSHKYVAKSEPVKPPEKTKSSYETEKNLNNSQIMIVFQADEEVQEGHVPKLNRQQSKDSTKQATTVHNHTYSGQVYEMQQDSFRVEKKHQKRIQQYMNKYPIQSDNLRETQIILNVDPKYKNISATSPEKKAIKVNGLSIISEESQSRPNSQIILSGIYEEDQEKKNNTFQEGSKFKKKLRVSLKDK